MGALEVRGPVPAARRLKTRVLAEDRTIIVVLGGRLVPSDTAGLVTELAEALELCCGLVILDVTGCRIDGDAIVSAVREAALCARRTDCDLRVITADTDTAIILDRAKISRVGSGSGRKERPWRP